MGQGWGQGSSQGYGSGRGPKGYKRSDERIREDVCDRLGSSWTFDASEIEVKVKDGEVTLDGTVNSRQDKRRAEDFVDNVSGVKHVQNNLRIKEQSMSSASSSGIGQQTSGSTSSG